LIGLFLIGLFLFGLFFGDLPEMLSQPLDAQRSPHPGIMPEGALEGTSAYCECETSGRRVQVRSTSGCGAIGVGHDGPGSGLRSLLVLRVCPHDDPQQLTLGGSLPTPDARPDGTIGAREDVELWSHRTSLYRDPA
jgi:hypothetical protein